VLAVKTQPDLAAKLDVFGRGPGKWGGRKRGKTMVAILAMQTSLPGCGTPGTSGEIRAEALFVSSLQPSGSPTPDQVRQAVATTLWRLGVRGCAAWMAGEFGDHPDTAAARMSWALETICTVYPAPPGSQRLNWDHLSARADRGVNPC
jgi:hypothetical protein